MTVWIFILLSILLRTTIKKKEKIKSLKITLEHQSNQFETGAEIPYKFFGVHKQRDGKNKVLEDRDGWVGGGGGRGGGWGWVG